VTGARLSEKKEKKKKKKKKQQPKHPAESLFDGTAGLIQSRPLKMDWHISLVYIRKESESMSVP
jgi:hypothetical protein